MDLLELNLAPFLTVLAATIATQFFISRHVRDETLGFARDIQRKYASAMRLCADAYLPTFPV